MRSAFHCPICDSPHVEMFFESLNIPVHCNVLHTSRDGAVHVPRGDLRLGFCSNCGHLYNYAFNERLVTYAETYENSLHFSPRFQLYAEELATNLIGRYNIRNKNIIEIGCGKGEFLKLLCDIGNNRGVGFDKSFEPANINNIENERFTVVQDHYDERYADYAADFLCCRHVLEHIASPREFLTTIRRAIGSREECAAYFEVPNGLFTLRDFGIWDLIYEHCSYFTPHSLRSLFNVCGFHVTNVAEQYNGQFLGAEALPGGRGKAAEAEPLNELVQYVSAFAKNYQESIVMWERRFEQFRTSGRRVVVWGGGSKGTTFLNVLAEASNVEFVVDLNPRKHAKFVAGTGQQIVAPTFLTEYKPDVLIVMNPIYVDEIRTLASQLEIQSEVLVA